MNRTSRVSGPPRAARGSLAFVAALLAAVGTGALAGDIAIERSTFSSGGGVLAGSGVEVRGTVAQGVVSVPTTAGATTVAHGFWSGGSGSDCPADLNSDGVVSTPDLTRFLGQFGITCAQVTGRCADFSGDGLINTGDLVFFLGRFGEACP
ncbi:MAG: hypothetical protein J0L61_08440 [Planctomycetes bacterium]|nr:hypothetical protein [Planctomycetota bacterium]